MSNFKVGDQWFGQPAGLRVVWVNPEGQPEDRMIFSLGWGHGTLDDGVAFDDDNVLTGRVQKKENEE